MQPVVWIVGDWRHEDFSAPMAWLPQVTRCTTFDHPAAALQASRADRKSNEPAAMLFAESHPGQIPAVDAERLLATSPLSRAVVLSGSWCEGPLRKGRGLTGIVRVSWSCWQSRLARELGLTECAAPLQPRTITETERIERDRPTLELPGQRRGRIAICSRSRISFQAIADAVERLGFVPIGQAGGRGFGVPAHEMEIYDGWEQVSGEDDFLVVAEGSGRPRRVLLLSFPRPDDFSRAARLGVDAVFAQPMLLGDLAAGLFRLMVERRWL